jgi:glycosyltransferase involved in cell wall biosynthesis
MNIKAPILFLAFNRPEATEVTFNRIREIQPSKLYVAIDGPRKDNSNEIELCKQVADITHKVDWSSNVYYLIREENLGCRDAIVDAISWVLSQEDRVIIIEDDVVPEIAFFRFADDLLELYKDNERVGMISGNNNTFLDNPDADYYFSKYAHIWGWATWQRVWSKFDVSCPEMKNTIRSKNLKKFVKHNDELKFFKWFFTYWYKKMARNEANAWGPFFFFFIFSNDLFSIVPTSNLAMNIGTEGLHTIKQSERHYWPTDKNYRINNHPKRVEHSVDYDRYHFVHHISEPIPLGLFRRIVNKFNSLN